jgi:hypothetical protein
VLVGSDVASAFSQLSDAGAGDEQPSAVSAGASLVDFDAGRGRLIGGVGDERHFGGEGADLLVLGATRTLRSPASGTGPRTGDFEDVVDRIDRIAGSPDRPARQRPRSRR